jgi:hypothetical protein
MLEEPMKIGLALFGLFASAVPPAAAQRGSDLHHWAALLQNAADRVEIDTASIRSRNGVREVWLRWSAGTGAGDMVSVYSIEQRDIDCVGQRTRVVRTEEVAATELDTELDTARRAIARAEGSAAQWHRPSSGSLLALAITAVCQSVSKAGA